MIIVLMITIFTSLISSSFMIHGSYLAYIVHTMSITMIPNDPVLGLKTWASVQASSSVGQWAAAAERTLPRCFGQPQVTRREAQNR